MAKKCRPSSIQAQRSLSVCSLLSIFRSKLHADLRESALHPSSGPTQPTTTTAPVLEAQQLFESLKLSWVEQSDGSVLALYDCSTPPKVQFTFGPKTVPLDRDAVSYGTTSNGQCIFSIIGQDISARTWILGDPIFLASKSITFDVAGKRVGFE